MTRSREGAAAVVSALAVGLALVTSACGGDDHGPSAGGDGEFPDGGPGQDGSVPEAPTNPEGPVVEILSPTEPEAGDYASDAILVSDRIQVICQVERNPDTSDPVDSASVLLSAVAGSTVVEAPAFPAGAVDEYAATLDVDDFPNGPISIRCTASDLAAEPRTNSAEVSTYLDLGPRIQVFTPTAGASYGQQVDISFVVTEDPVADDDELAAVADVSLRAGSVPIAIVEEGDGAYSATVDFDAPEFDPPLDGLVSLTIEASNSRTATAVTRSDVVPFVADSGGPTIQIDEPTAGLLVGGFMDITVHVTDPAGIESVIATIAHQYEIELPLAEDDTFTASFDTRQLDDSWVFPLLEVRARDHVGNEASVGRIVALDNRPPLVSMDSPPMREAKCLVGDFCAVSEAICSILFDPLGSDAADDGEVVGGLIELRVRAEDQGNGALAPSGVVVPLAGIDEISVEFFVLDDQNGALLVDTDDDDVCDAINPALVPTSVPDTANEAAVVTLAVVEPSGDPSYPAVSGPFGTLAEVADDDCNDPAADADSDPPSPLCISSPTTRAPATDFGAPILFTIPPTQDPWCVGNAFDAPATNIADGWACIAAVAPDALGNVGVSPPLRLCIDHDGDHLDDDGNSLAALGCGVGGNATADFGDIAPEVDRPVCTDGCTLPANFGDFPFMQIRVTGGI